MKTATDRHWSQRAESVEGDHDVNIMDVFQRELEYGYIERFLEPGMILLETGCGNGYSTRRFREKVRHVDAFDYAEEMIVRARATFGETNNKFFHDNVLAPVRIGNEYDAVLCVRVLINLRDLEEQKVALENLRVRVRPGGLLILVEGFRDGFEELTALREDLGLPAVQPAPINFYSSLVELRPEADPRFVLQDEFHLGAYDYLTRVVYPLIVGPDNVAHNSVFAERCHRLASAFNPDSLGHLSRIRGFVLRRRPDTIGADGLSE